MSLNYKKFDIDGPILIYPKTYEDNRGLFMELYRQSDFSDIGVNTKFIQDNYSKSSKGVIRGLHYQQYPQSQGKLIRVIRGEIFDVAVDIRSESKTFGKYIYVYLSDKNKMSFWIPSGFAHGFLAMKNNTEIMYKCTSEYDSEYDRGIIYNDKTINIRWPKINVNYILSEKDLSLPEFNSIEFHKLH